MKLKNKVKKILISIFIITLILGVAFLYQKTIMNKERNQFEYAIQQIIDDNYAEALDSIEKLKYIDNQELIQYCIIQKSIDEKEYDIDSISDVIKELEQIDLTSIDNEALLKQKDETLQQLNNAIDIQKEISDINLIDIDKEYGKELENIKSRIDKTEKRYLFLLDTYRYDIAEKIIDNINNNTEVGNLYVGINNIKDITYYSGHIIEEMDNTFKNMTKKEKELITNIEKLDNAKKILNDLQNERKEKGIITKNNELINRYYEDEIDNTIYILKEYEDENKLVFFLCTDIHYMSTTEQRIKDDTITDMSMNMQYISENIDVDGIICLGDITDGRLSTEETSSYVQYIMNRFNSINLPLLFVIGNHDDNRYRNKATECFTPEQISELYFSNVTDKKISNDMYYGLDYYVDYDEANLRIICLDCNYYDGTRWRYGFADETAIWFDQVLDETPLDKQVMILDHMGLIQENNWKFTDLQNSDRMRTRLQKFINDGGTYVATIYGHSHVDYDNNNQWLEICTASAKCANFTLNENFPVGSIVQERIKDTASEDLWDIMVFLPEKKQIDLIRFGAGEDRSFNY